MSRVTLLSVIPLGIILVLNPGSAYSQIERDDDVIIDDGHDDWAAEWRERGYDPDDIQQTQGLLDDLKEQKGENQGSSYIPDPSNYSLGAGELKLDRSGLDAVKKLLEDMNNESPAEGAGPKEGSSMDRFESAVTKTTAESGKRFATKQDEVNYHLCQSGDKKFCGRYTIVSEEEEDTGPDTKGASREKGEPRRTSDGSIVGGDAGGPSQTDFDAAPDPKVAPAEEARRKEDLAERKRRVEERSRRMGESLKNGFDSEGFAGGGGSDGAFGGDGGGVDGGAGGNGSSREGDQDFGSGIDPANPTSQKALILASVSGFQGSFEAIGLTVGRDASGAKAILGKNGSPASAEAIAKLRAHIRSEPKALLRNRRFFDPERGGISRSNFEDLKDKFRRRPGSHTSAFKHVTLTSEDRDFVFSRSCAMMSGDCNKHIGGMSYKKGAHVAPAGLVRIGESLSEGDADGEFGEDYFDEDDDWLDEDTVVAAARPPRRGLFSGSVKKVIYAKLNGMINAINAGMGKGPSGGGASAPRAMGGARATAGGGRPSYEFTTGSKVRRDTLALDPVGSPGAPGDPSSAVRAGAPVPRGVAGGALALLVVGGLWVYSRRRRRGEDDPDVA